MKVRISILTLLLFASVTSAFGQVETKKEAAAGAGAETKPESETKPLELPNYIIEGREQIDLQSSGIKQYPEKSFQLSKNQLDSINSLEKQPSLLLPPEPLPERSMKTAMSRGFLSGEFGRFMTPSIEGAYEFKISDYSIYANAGLEMSQGHVDNAGYSQGYAKIMSDYIAPEKYWIFGGSKTKFDARFGGKNYKLYAVGTDAPVRSTTQGGISIASEGNFEGYKFTTGASLSTLQLDQDKAKSFDNAMDGFLYVSGYWDNYEAGLGAKIDLHSVHGDGADLMQADASFRYLYQNFSFDFNAGLQTVKNTANITRLGLLLKVDGEYRFSNMMTFRALLFSGYENNSFSGMLEQNPYLSGRADVDYVNNTHIKGYLSYHPTVNLSVSAGAVLGITRRNPVFYTADTATFLVRYMDSKEAGMFGEIDWQPTDADRINANITIESSSLDSNSKETPNSVPIKAALNYRRAWMENFGTQIGFNYIGERYADIDNKEELPGYLDLNIRADYNLNEGLTVYGKLSNLLNSEVYIWQGYKERSLFVSAGILWKF